MQLGSAALTLPYVREGQFPDTSDPPAMLSATASQVQPAASALATTVVGELVDPGGLAACAAEIAVRQRSPETRRTYAAVYRAFAPVLALGPWPALPRAA